MELDLMTAINTSKEFFPPKKPTIGGKNSLKTLSKLLSPFFYLLTNGPMRVARSSFISSSTTDSGD